MHGDADQSDQRDRTEHFDGTSDVALSYRRLGQHLTATQTTPDPDGWTQTVTFAYNNALQLQSETWVADPDAPAYDKIITRKYQTTGTPEPAAIGLMGWASRRCFVVGGNCRRQQTIVIRRCGAKEALRRRPVNSRLSLRERRRLALQAGVSTRCGPVSVFVSAKRGAN